MLENMLQKFNRSCRNKKNKIWTLC